MMVDTSPWLTSPPPSPPSPPSPRNPLLRGVGGQTNFRQKKFHPQKDFHSIYTSQRQHLPPTLEITVRNFSKFSTIFKILKDKDEYKDKGKDKHAERITESLTVCYIFSILMTQAFQE